MTSSSTVFDVIIIGSGPAGSTGALYTSRASLKTLVIGGNPPGGQLVNTTLVENFPGFPNGILGPELVSNIRKQMKNYGSTVVDENVVKVSGSFKDGFTVETDLNNKYIGKTILVASGSSAKWLGLESEQRLKGYGVSACAVCDGPLYKGKIVAIVGGGDASMEESVYLTRFVERVYVLVRSAKGEMKASKIMQKRAFSNPKLEFLFNTEVKEILGEKFVEGLRIFNNKTNEESELKDIKGVFIAVGHQPNTEFLRGVVELDEKGYIKTFGKHMTSVEGVFVAGDVHDYNYRQAVTASGYGCIAATELIRFLTGER
ncbi:thioredoxin-disulfide reductase [Patescibacteria group bacterium]|nr:thioredoxin-disulfide reductase [Patescibacteria group bacterium]MBU1952875.1 thioredoxin-disulfide reductase [Patescibacteria group bacterium]